MLPSPPATTTAAPARLPSLTGLRWTAAFVVFAFHLHVAGILHGRTGDAARVLLGGGSAGVSFFFVLSGFVLAWSYRRRPGFHRARFARVYPLHLVTAVVTLLVLIPYEHSAAPPRPALLANLTLTHAWVPRPEYVQSLNTVSWTLSCEALFYALLPCLMAATRRLNPTGLWLSGAAATLVVAAGPAVLTAFAGRGAATWFFHWTPPGRLPEFVAGVVLARLVATGAWRFHPPLPAAAALAAGACVLAGFTPAPYRYAAATLPAFVVLIAAAARTDRSGRGSAAARPWPYGWAKASDDLLLGQAFFGASFHVGAGARVPET
ncbi:acyltransferase family protein [Pseudosporangium ferrugineum]|uniref:Peptidoglycan/LPS O-acetylase OafA/YrhL n=1 Tax=Pseudosporangium ferrugineum TaxID=439699 RepID=A0A2T0SBD8_9ACTN|nr:acyltransferase [Pseudosporangium ferrugineum]PRY30728.1 peptidoglycan/LPS O-acetylase OafA/YrhL [Pseudosporangium ferrugineum]